MRVHELIANRVITDSLRNHDGTLNLSLAELKNLDALAAAASSTEWGAIDGVTAGTVLASKVVVVDSNKDVSAFRTVGLVNLDAGSSGVAGTVDVFPATASRGKFILSCTNQTGDTSVTLKPDAMGQASVLHLADYGLADSYLLQGKAAQTASAALLFGAGASGANHALGATAGNALEFYLNATHTTGDMRGMYLREYFSGAGGSGEAARIFSTINGVSVATGGTVNGAHISIGTAGAGAAVSGQANALRVTFGIAAASTNIGGTCAVITAETDMDTAVTVPTNMAFLRLVNLGVKKANNLLRVPDVAAVTGGLFCAHTTQAMSHSLKFVSDDGTAYYVMCTNAATNRTES